MIVKITDGVLREKAAKNGKNLGTVSGEYEVKGMHPTDVGTTWYQIEDGERIGWVIDSDATVFEDAELTSNDNTSNSEDESGSSESMQTPESATTDDTPNIEDGPVADAEPSDETSQPLEDEEPTPEVADGGSNVSGSDDSSGEDTSSNDETPKTVSTNLSDYQVGYTVRIKPGSKHYSSSESTSGAYVKEGLAIIEDVDEGELHPLRVRAVTSSGNLTDGVNGWVDVEDVQLMRVRFPKRSY